MSLIDLHPWDLSPEAAILVQARMQSRLILRWDGCMVSTIGGVATREKENLTCAAIVVLRYPDLTPIEAVTADTPLVFPYVPGLLAFREGPAVLAA